MIPILERCWECPNCDSTLVTHNRKQAYHQCRGLKGLMAPYVPAGTPAKVEQVDRGDWVGKEHVQLDGEGRPVMAIVTTRNDGQDCTVLAPCAAGRQE